MPPTRFLCDEMLTGLGRWLRAAGHDTLLAPKGAADGRLVALAGIEGRLLLTRDRAILDHKAAAGIALVLEADGLDGWAVELRRRMGLDWTMAPFTRCLVCNTCLTPARAEHVAAVPEDSRGLGPVQWCVQCRKPYWRGGHVRRMEARLARWVGGA
ncbi:MAG TPA: Mut7-C RNAse domain-containing protein [Candidatus Omnitrophota bacterium]|nr:Mut7-C RNAse domain-containing protein [Candidatus Omnitrophota bacterium]